MGLFKKRPSSKESVNDSSTPRRRRKIGDDIVSGSSRGSVRVRRGFGELDRATREITEERARQGKKDEQIINVGKLSKEEKKRLKESMGATLDVYPHLLAIKPRERYIFHSDYFEMDGRVATILSFFHNDEARDDFSSFWGVNRIPDRLGDESDGITAVVFEQVDRMPDKWVDDALNKADKMDKIEDREQQSGGTASTKRRAVKVSQDMNTVVAEYQDGASYLNVHNRIMIQAPTLEKLDSVLEHLTRLYIDRFATLKAAPYHGEQRRELSTLLDYNKNKRGNGFHYTSVEYAGSYSLVTNGLNDPDGEYVGFLMGDVNNSAILFNVDGWDEHIVLADETINPRPMLERSRVVDMWGSKISQAALLNNHRVVHLILNDANLDVMGPKLESITSVMDMNRGDINMFEFFGAQDDELSLFPVQLEKLTLMAEQVLGMRNSEALPIIRSSLKRELVSFYTDQKMWFPNAKDHREHLRLVGLPHEEVPRLQVFVSYLETAHQKQLAEGGKDADILRAINVLRGVFRDMLDSNGDLFNQTTNPHVDRVHNSRRVVYDFGDLLRRGRGIAMAQLVNVVGFATDALEAGDVVIVHGADTITDEMVQKYLSQQFSFLRRKGARVAYLYDDIDAMIEQQGFNRFTRADYTVLGPMSTETIVDYQDAMNTDVPPDLQKLITMSNSGLSYLRRNMTNVIFATDLALGINPERKRLAAERRGDSGNDSIASTAQSMAPGVDGEDESARNSRYGGGTGTYGEADGDPVEAARREAEEEVRESNRTDALEEYDERQRRRLSDDEPTEGDNDQTGSHGDETSSVDLVDENPVRKLQKARAQSGSSRRTPRKKPSPRPGRGLAEAVPTQQ